ncbi:MAG: ATPase, T2SS/T4P/T4SS family [Candidatus Andersenbacteria bacterium]
MPDAVDESTLRSLVEQKLLTVTQADEILKKLGEGGADLHSLVVDSGLIKDHDFTQVQAAVLGMTYIDLRAVTIPRELLNIIPESTAREHLIVAYEQTDSELKLAMVNPSDRQIVEFIRKKVDMPIAVALASRQGIMAALQQYQQTLTLELENVLATSKSVMTEADLNKAAEDLPVVRITDLILKHAILQGSSDIHIEPTEQNVIVRYRIDGILHDALTLPRYVLAGLVARIKVLSRLKIDEHRLPQDGRFKIESEDYKIAFRVSILPVFDGEKVVMRLLDESGHGLGLDSIGLRPSVLEVFRRNINKPNGLILVTGPTGSGKTTTLYAAMKELNQADVNISTVEDPIEYRMPRINQTQVNPKIGLTFSNGLRSLVRQDPDILMVGEIRDEETASLAVNAALTGHLVLSTLHTNSAAGALPRLLDMKVEAFLVASTVNLLIAQRLVRRLCQECRREQKLTKDVVTELAKSFSIETLVATLVREGVVADKQALEDLVVYEAVGCKLCQDGYKGRSGIYELLEMTDSIRKIITSKTTTAELEDAARAEQGMVTMIEDGFIKVVEGQTTIEEVMRVSME